LNTIYSIDINKFVGFNKLENLYLEDSKIEYGLFNHLENLKELWLETNNIISIDSNVFVGLNKLENVCLNDNPIILIFPSNV
jgi:Leucine-rich repeat (LRR) protein